MGIPLNSDAPSPRSTPEPIAIVGVGCRFPGNANTPSKLWDLLNEPYETGKDIPINRFNLNKFYHPDGSHHGTCNVKRTYFLDEDVRVFDAGFFGIPPGEAAAMDPQHRLLMETVYEAMETAGMTISSLQGSDTAVYVGIMCSDYYILGAQDYREVPTYNSTGIANSNASARLSYFFDWHGPCMTLDTACSSSLVALHQAVQSLRAGTSRVAVAAGTNLLLSPMGYISESKLGMLSPSGRCQMWDANADGYARGEGVAAVMLKKLSDAIADGDDIQCIVRETGVNQDGKTKGITMPSAITQAALIRETYARAGLDLNAKWDRPQYFEAHGTGTPAGDPQEAEALHTAFFSGESYEPDEVLHVGSIKTVIGHTEGTAGLAGIIKAYLAMKHGVIPPNLHFNNLSPAVSPFYDHLNLVTVQQPWPILPTDVPRRASVNSFGFGGTNAHAILESYGQLDRGTPLTAAPSEPVSPFLPYLFSAASEKSLRILVESYGEYLNNNPGIDVRKLAYTLACHRSAFAYKISYPAAGQEELSKAIETSLSAESSPFTSRSSVKEPSILGIFTGQGAQWPQMGAQLIQSSLYAENIITELDMALTALPESDRPSWTLRDELLANADTSRLGEAAVAQPVTCAVQIMLVGLLRRAGVRFQSVVGHSSGEIAAAYAAGFISSTDAIRIAYYRGFHSKLAKGPSGQLGGMLAVGTSYEDAQELCALEDFEGRIVVAASNSATSVTISGDLDAIEEVKVILEEEEKFVRSLRVDKAYHSHHMKSVAQSFIDSLRACSITLLTPPADAPTWHSSVYQDTVIDANTALDGQYWTDNLNRPVLFSQALETASKSVELFNAALEVGPHPTLKGPALDTIQQATNGKLEYIGCLSRGKNDIQSFSGALGAIWSAAGPSAVDFSAFQAAVFEDASTITAFDDLPRYPWSHDRVLWAESRSTKLMRQQDDHWHDILGTREADGTEEEWRWRNILTPKELPWLTDHALQGQTVFPATGYFCLAMEAIMQVAGKRPVQLLELTDLKIRKAIAIDERDGTETIVSLTKIQQDEQEITAYFACFSTISRDSLQLALNSTGNVRVILGEPAPDILAPRSPPIHGMQPVDSEHFYEEVAKIGYNYGPTFRGIQSLERKLGHSRGKIVGPPNNETGTALLFHPGMLDAALQGMLCGFSSPGDGRLWSLHAPSTIRRVTLVPSLCGMDMTKEVHFDCAVTDVEFNRLTGDVEVFQSDTGYKSISVEGTSFIPFTAATHIHDRQLFAYDGWGLEAPNGALALGSYRATADEIQKGLDAERVAFYYLRALHETVPQDERTALQLPSHHEALFDYAQHIYDIVQKDEHAYVKREWMNDTYEEICAIMERYGPKDPDFLLIAASGENLPAVVRGETTILEHMTKGNKLNNYYQNALGFHKLNELISITAAQIAHRYPNMNICEIGAGTGGSSRAIFGKLGAAYTSYTYTDISAGFFEKAQEEFAPYRNRMIYKTLDITSSPVDQGFVEGAYDLVVAANVLHATPDLEETLRSTRRLLKPGGYLVMMEFIDESVMRLGVIIGGLPGWWVGRETGRRYSPNVPLEQWNELLLKSGFGGIDTHTPVYDPVVMPASIITARAIDDQITMLKSPLSIAEGSLPSSKRTDLIILGGSKNTTMALVDGVSSYLKPHYKSVIQINALEDLNVTSIPEKCSVINLSDFDGPFWTDITTDRFEKLKALLMVSVNLLWVTWGSSRDNGDGAMTVGFFRSLFYELPESQLQILTLESPAPESGTASLIAERILRLEITTGWQRTPSGNGKLWSIEPEYRMEQGEILVPRVIPERHQNDRYNSAKRKIITEVNLKQAIVTLGWGNNEYNLREQETSSFPTLPGYRRVRVDTSILSSLLTPAGRLFVSLGTDLDNGGRVLSVSPKNASTIQVSEQWSVPVDVGRGIDVQYLSFLLGYLSSRNIAALLPCGGTLVAHEPDPGLASMLSRHPAMSGSRVVFTTSNPQLVRRNWVLLHPRTPSRQLKAALPRDVSMYLDLSSDWSTVPCTESLGSRISACLPPLCEKFDGAVLGARESSQRPGSHDESIHQLLMDVNAFAVAQLNGVPDGMPMRLYPLSYIVSNTEPLGPMSLVNWHSESEVPVQVEPIFNRNDLFQPDKTYWLLGLAGDLGRSLCDFMVTRGAQHVVLSSRNPVADTQWIEDHALQGVTVSYLKADITDRADLERAREELLQTAPPIAGVANGALVLRDKGLINMDLDTFHANTRCKVEGTTYLDEMFPDNTLDFFIAFSSISATVGNMGQMAYTAANMFMKALISQRRHRNVAGSVIDISQVFGVGYVEREMKLRNAMSREQAIRLMDKSGTIIMSEPDLHQLFAEAVISGRPDSQLDPNIITGVKTMTTAESKDAIWRSNPRFGHFIQDVGAVKAPSATKAATIPVKTQLEGAKDAEEMSTILKAALTAKLKSSLLMNDETIAETTPLIDLGVDSLVAVEIRTWFAQEVSMDVAVLKILGGPSIQELVDDTLAKLLPTVA
ncbi:Beta-ketoacyl synthase, active site protein [Arthroderma uncinatum]|uniref:Beta-ketoacyl synthase, active site protein n=1 Tax=Arthroderma uncinatum TaxID=74035 RepID=UPI00144AA7F7|nr:Beta-ketoacyl synthase, active site protein [Arthroderma uncinatum]KAF3480350.1 Beta-ketoacyl synthase, active site protein [Arthroderma uncinatum]